MNEVEIPVDAFVRVFGIESLVGVKIRVKVPNDFYRRMPKIMIIEECLRMVESSLYPGTFIYDLKIKGDTLRGKPRDRILFGIDIVIVGSQ